MTFRVGILGGGGISSTHARAAREITEVEITAVCGENKEKVAGLAEECGAKPFFDLGAFLDSSLLDIVLIGSPSGLHAEQAIEAARRGIHVLAEKPVAITTKQADRLIEECERAGVKLGVFFQDRFAPDVMRLKVMLDEGALGRPFLVSGRVKWHRPAQYYKGSRWRGTWALDGGGALMNQAIHTVDLLLWLIGDVSRVSARAVTALHDIEVEDTVVAMIEFSNGAVGTFEAATSAYPGYPRRIEVTGSEGSFILEDNKLVTCDLRSNPAPAPREESNAGDNRAATHTISDASGHRRVIEDFLNAISANRSPACDGHHARRSVEMVEAIYESSRIGGPVSLAKHD